MPTIDCIVQSNLELSTRSKQVCGMFDVPIAEKQMLQWKIDAPIETRNWNIGLIVGPSGSGKSTIARHLWNSQVDSEVTWTNQSVIDDFDDDLSLQEITTACSSVGFNTIPAWIRPFSVLSNGEQFRVTMARLILERDFSVVDEFTSVVDRQVAQIGSHAIQKYVRAQHKQFVAVSCHYDVIDWLQPDWIIDASDQTFKWRSLQQRPEIKCQIKRVRYDKWKTFSKYHYLTSTLPRAARCFGLFVQNNLVAFTGVMHRPHPNGGWKAISRTVTLPSWQGLGLSFALNDTIASAYCALGWKFRNYPAHPSYIRSHKKSKVWKNCGQSIPSRRSKSASKSLKKYSKNNLRTPWIFEYRGPKMNTTKAKLFIAGAL